MAAAKDAGMGDIRRLLVLPAVGLVGCGLLSACYMGPDPVQYGALAVLNGKATAVVALCGRSASDLSVYQNDNNPTDHELRDWSVTLTVSRPVQDVAVELLGEGSPTTTRVSSHTLKSFERGHHYTLNASEGGPEGTDAPTVTFTTDDLARIGEGQVLAPIDYKKSDVVSRESFVKDACAKKGPGAG
jgi:hypothetical protein